MSLNISSEAHAGLQIRMVDALAFHQEHGEVCPAGWKEGDKGMDASPEGVAKYLAENAESL